MRDEKRARKADGLMRALAEGTSDDRAWDTEELADLDHRPAAELLAGMVNDQDPAVRLHAARGLARLGDERAVDPLLRIVRDDASKRGARRTAVTGLAVVGGARAVAEFQRYANADWMGWLARDDGIEAIVERGDVAELEMIGRAPAPDPGPDPERERVERRELEYRVGRMVASDFQREIEAEARRFGVTVETELGQGVLMRTLRVTAKGRVADIERMDAYVRTAYSPGIGDGP